MTRMQGALLVSVVCTVTLTGSTRPGWAADDKTKAQQQTAQGACSLGSAAAELDQNNVRARLFNTGHLFWNGSRGVYTVPKTRQANAIFASGIWIGGLVGNELRFAGTAYGPFEFWPGPLDEAGNPPADCTPYDHIYSVTKADLERYASTGQATGDITNWPWQLGAPVADGDGNPNNYNLAGGDRPGIIGEQTAWWVMNDAGGSKGWSRTAPMNLEVQVTAFAFRTADALNNTTFYKYKLIYKGDQPLRDTYFGIWSDPDLGDAVSDYVASDTIRGIGYVYNGTEVDPGTDGYGDKPPALGYDFFQGPLVAGDGIDNDRDGIVDETNTPGVDDDGDGEVDEFDEDERLQMSKFVYYNNDSSEQGNPDGASDDPYNYLRGIWRDGTPMTFGGTGYGGDTPTDYMFSGDPVTGEYWSEENTDGTGKANTPHDRRFLMSAGPFTMQPGDVQEIVYGIVWAQGRDRLGSVTELRAAADRVQAAFETGFQDVTTPRPPTGVPVPMAPVREAAGQPRNPTLVWGRVDGVQGYEVQVARDAAFTWEVASWATFDQVVVPTLEANTVYYWRVRAEGAGGYGPWSEVRRFTTASLLLAEGDVLRLSEGTPAFVEVAGPSDDYGCGPLAGSRFGCDAVGGNLVYGSYNGNGEYIMYYALAWNGPEAVIGNYAPNDFEIRFTAEGSYGYWRVQAPYNVARVPFEIWDIGPTGPFGENNPEDDVRLVPVLYAGSGSDGTCVFGAGEGTGQFRDLETWTITDYLYAYYPDRNDYAAWEAAARAVVEGDADGCAPITDEARTRVDYGRGMPLQHVTFNMNPAVPQPYPSAGVVVRFYTTAHGMTSPMPAVPQDSSAVTAAPLRLRWHRPPGTVRQRLQVSTGPDFSNLLVDEATLEGSSFLLEGVTPGTTYYWRIRGINSRQVPSAWSPVWRFTAREAVFEAVLGGANQVPATTSPARGHLQAALEGTQLSVRGAFEGLLGPLEADGAALHVGTPADTAVHVLQVQTAQGGGAGTFAPAHNTFDLTAAEVEALRQGGAWVALRSAAYPAGEVRGQLLPMGNQPPTGAAWPTGARSIELEQDASAPVVLSWAAAADPDGHPVRYLWQMADEEDFRSVLASVDAGGGTRYETTVGAVAALVEAAGVDLRAGARLYHRITATDGSLYTGGLGAPLHLLRAGVVTTEEAPGLPTAFTLEANYPNPFNPQTTIRFGLPEAAAVRLVVYDVVGRRVAVLRAGEVLPAGWHDIGFDGSGLASGVYFYRIEAGRFQQVRPMILMK